MFACRSPAACFPPHPAWQASEQRDDAVGLGVLALSLLLLVGGPLGVVALWFTRGRDPKLGLVVPDYITEPLITAAGHGRLIDRRKSRHVQDIVSTLIDLAHRGYLTMEEGKEELRSPEQKSRQAGCVILNRPSERNIPAAKNRAH